MIIILHPNVDRDGEDYHTLLHFLDGLEGIRYRFHEITGSQRSVTEIYLLGDTAGLDSGSIQGFAVVERVVRISREYRILGRHEGDSRASEFTYNGVRFAQDNLHVFAGLCAVDTREHVEAMMRALKQQQLVCTRMGAYKPRTSPYSFQGHGAACLPYVFELAGKYGIRVIAMEVTHDSHVREIHDALEAAGRPTGVMLQIGTRNTQNFELLKSVGRQQEFPVLLKRGFGITLNESLNAAEYLASAGNSRVVFCLRGMKTNMGDPHRNLVDFGHVATVKHLSRMPVCIDPSHSVGSLNVGPDGIPDVFHATAQGVIAGANMVLVDFHPNPPWALVDSGQALRLEALPWFLQDIEAARQAYLRRCELVPAAG